MDLTEFTTEEMLALASGLGLRDPAFLAGEPFSSWTPEVRAEVDAMGRRSLAARSVIQLDDDGTARIPDVLAKLCTVLSEPDVFIRISNVDPEGYRMASFLITRESCAGLRLTQLGNYRFTLAEASVTRQAMAEILQLDDPQLAAAAGESKIEIPIEELQRIVADRTSQPDEELDALIARTGLASDVAEALRPLMTENTAGWSVEVLAPSVETSALEGSITTWVATAAGAWMATAASTDAGSNICYRPVSGQDLQTSIDEGLPAWLAG